jgi:signal transduction histidine kinase/DNA-binding NarL/FixJ family response regulator
MNTLLVISDQNSFADSLRPVLDADRFTIIARSEVLPGDSFLSRSQADVCILDGDLTSVKPIRMIESVLRLLPLCPIIVFSSARQWEWEEDAYLLGVMHVLSKPVRGALLNAVLDRLLEKEPRPARTRRPAAATQMPAEPRPAQFSLAASRPLEVFRSFSSLLPHGLSTDTLLAEFLKLLRETVAVNRAAVFLKPPPGSPGSGADRRLKSACAIGVPSDIIKNFGLSLEFGVGRKIDQDGRILRRDAPEAFDDAECRREFDLLGAEVALPILDRENMVGVAFLDRRITGEPLTSEELAVIFYMLEALAMAIRNIWLHEEVSTSQKMLADILRELKSGCIVVGQDLEIQHANRMAFEIFGAAPGSKLRFKDIPQALGSRIFEALKSGVATVPFNYSPPNNGVHVYQIVIAPFMKQTGAQPGAVLVLIEDCTQSERLRQVEIEASNLRMIKTMAERLAHEVGNAIVPLSTHQQLLADNYQDPEFRVSLEAALLDGVKRIARLGQQMLFLAQDRPASSEPISVAKLIEDAFSEAQKNLGEQPVTLQYETGGKPLMLTGDRAGLKHALAEVMLNALQANAPTPRVKVEAREDADQLGGHWVRIEVQDSGTGFTAESSRKAPEPFFTTRNVGLGLGLTVSRKIIEMHHGSIEISDAKDCHSGRVTITLPLSAI